MKYSLTILFIFCCLMIYGQKKLKFNPSKIQLDTSIIVVTQQIPFNYLYHYDQELSKDLKIVKKYNNLLNEIPTEKNYDKYFNLACSYWNLSENAKAEKLFLNILNSDLEQYNRTEIFKSDIPGDTTTNIYGYGSYTYNYKNKSCIYLCKINIEKQNFIDAKKYIELADKKYLTYHSCGTGYRMQQDEYNFLYASAYYGLGMYKDILKLLMPEVLDRNDEITVKAIKKLYSKAEIENEIRKAENEITIEIDKEPNYSYTSWIDPKSKKEITDSTLYYPATAKIILFNYEIEMTNFEMDDINKINKELFITEFRNRDFYKNLMKAN